MPLTTGESTGLPQGDIPLALFASNVGVEVGQRAFITLNRFDPWRTLGDDSAIVFTANIDALAAIST